MLPLWRSRLDWAKKVVLGLHRSKTFPGSRDVCPTKGTEHFICGAVVSTARKIELDKSRDPYRNIDGFDRHYRRLPHFQIEGNLYASASRTYDFRKLTNGEREIVFNAVWFLDGKKYDLHGVVVMPDHFHLLIKPLKVDDKTHSLGRIIHSLKSFTAHEIAKKSDGRVWQDERYDRVVRNEKEYHEQLKYLRDNPAEAGLTEPGESYPWMWHIGMPKPVRAVETTAPQKE